MIDDNSIDYYNNGIFEIKRFGNDIIMKNNLTQEERIELNENIKQHYDELYNEICKEVIAVKDKVLKCNPLRLLKFSSDIEQLSNYNNFSEFTNNQVSRFTEYIQSIFVSQSTIKSTAKDLDETKLFNEILYDIEQIYTKIQHFYICWGAKLDEIIPNIDDNKRQFLVEAQMLYGVRVKRYQYFEIEYFESLLNVHDEVLQRLFNIDYKCIIEGLKNIQYSLTQEIIDVVNNVGDLFEPYDFSEIDDISIEENEKLAISEFVNKFIGNDLNDVMKVTKWSKEFVDALSWEINENKDFFNDQSFCGWPVIDLPIFKRPFIKIEGVSYCFDYSSLFDNFYRAIQKTVTRIDKNYTWSDYQQEASEIMVENVFKTLLPNCETFASNYYPVKNSLKQMAENDLIVIYDNVLFIVEVKAGSFVFTAPINDYNGHIDAYKTLIEKADSQCNRTKIYLEKNEDAILYDSNKNPKPKTKIDMTKIVKIYTMSVTIDNINEFAAKTEKLKFLQLDSEAISISIDDLAVYRDYFDSPLQFLHFIEQRYLAIQEPKLNLNDELDHLGMYVTHNCYYMQTDVIPDGVNGFFMGYREDLDYYFNTMQFPHLKVEKPKQYIPELILNIINYLDSSQIKNRSIIANYFLDFSSETKEEFCENIIFTLERQRVIGSERVLQVSLGHKSGYTCFVTQKGLVDLDKNQKRVRTLATMLWNDDNERYLIDLYFDENDNFKKIDFIKYTQKNIDKTEYEYIKLLGEKIAEYRVDQYKKKNNGKIGRNTICPCGRGRKYKSCCLK